MSVRLLFLAGALLAPAVGSAAGPAFAIFPALAGRPYANASVLEIRGERGAPQPDEWVITLRDTTSRSGVREVTLIDGKITAERTPIQGAGSTASLAPVQRADARADADAAFRIAQREAVEHEVGFDWVEYTLLTDPATGTPVWTLKLLDELGFPVGTVRVSAKTGEIVQPFTTETAPTPPPTDSREPGVAGAIGKSLGKAARGVSDSTSEFWGSLKKEFSGDGAPGPQKDD